MTDDQTPRIQYALESLPELLCERDLRLICNAMNVKPYHIIHRDNIRYYVEEAVSNHEKQEARQAQEIQKIQQREYESTLTIDDEGFRSWDGWLYPNGPTRNMFPALRDLPEGIPTAEPLIIEVEFNTGRRATLEDELINWSRVKRWKVVE